MPRKDKEKIREYDAKRYKIKRESILATNALWRKANAAWLKTYYALYKPQQNKLKAKAWREANKEHLCVSKIAWRLKNADKIKQQAATWAKQNKAIVCHLARTRRARKSNAAGFASVDAVKARADYYGNKCAYCKRKQAEHIDHVIPLVRGGTNWPANLRPACASCNTSKGSKSLTEWRRQISKRSEMNYVGGTG